MTFDPSKLTERLIEAGEEWANNNASADLLEETSKTLKAQLALKFIPEAGSVSRAETMALATQEYIEHIKSMVEARRKANISRVRYDTGKSYCELVRSKESTDRAEMMLR